MAMSATAITARRVLVNASFLMNTSLEIRRAGGSLRMTNFAGLWAFEVHGFGGHVGVFEAGSGVEEDYFVGGV